MGNICMRGDEIERNKILEDKKKQMEENRKALEEKKKKILEEREAAKQGTKQKSRIQTTINYLIFKHNETD